MRPGRTSGASYRERVATRRLRTGNEGRPPGTVRPKPAQHPNPSQPPQALGVGARRTGTSTPPLPLARPRLARIWRGAPTKHRARHVWVTCHATNNRQQGPEHIKHGAQQGVGEGSDVTGTEARWSKWKGRHTNASQAKAREAPRGFGAAKAVLRGQEAGPGPSDKPGRPTDSSDRMSATLNQLGCLRTEPPGPRPSSRGLLV